MKSKKTKHSRTLAEKIAKRTLRFKNKRLLKRLAPYIVYGDEMAYPKPFAYRALAKGRGAEKILEVLLTLVTVEGRAKIVLKDVVAPRQVKGHQIQIFQFLIGIEKSIGGVTCYIART